MKYSLLEEYFYSYNVISIVQDPKNILNRINYKIGKYISTFKEPSHCEREPNFCACLISTATKRIDDS
jgi:hypothetical protein